MDNKKKNESSWKIFCGTLCHSTDKEAMEIIENAIIGIKGKTIAFVGLQKDEAKYRLAYGFNANDVTYLSRGQMLMPGFVDTHIHSAQFPFCGTGFEKPLLQWLNDYTFKEERKSSETNHAQLVNKTIVARTISNGTTTAQYFGSIYTDAAINLCHVAAQVGQRVLVGKSSHDFFPNVNFNENNLYVENTEESIRETERFVQNVLNMKNDLIAPVITPRFAVTCTSNLMFKLGDIAKRYDIRIQSHLCENLDEIKTVEELFPDCKSYTDVYLKHGLLTNKTLMAHGIHLTDEELDVLVENQTSISHCPSSNYNLGSGLCNVRRLLNKGIVVGLGTDVAGGHNYSILSQIREGFTTSTTFLHGICANGSSTRPLRYEELFRLATLGGAKSLGLDHKTGNFEVGKEFDAIFVDTSASKGPIDIFNSDNQVDIVKKFLTLGDDRNILRVYVSGKLVWNTTDL